MTTQTKSSRKSYGQYCPVARTLDVVGERWTLLIVRDLLMGPKRYTDLRAGLPGIATDLLTARLRILEEEGFVRRRELPRPAPATVYELTEDGRQLRHAIRALGRVGISTLGGPRPDEDVRAERLVVGLRASFRGDEFAELTEIYELTIDDEPFTVEVSDGAVDARPGTAPNPAIRLRTDTDTFVALMTGELTAHGALKGGRAALEGDRRALDRFTKAFAWGQVS
jgi:DNA-binding HxlR family transcriptional regulator/putative sterol carrier protein